MEREYLVAFVIVLIVIFIGLIFTSGYFAKIWSNVNEISDKVLGTSKEKEAKATTAYNIKKTIEALAKCKTSKNYCGCDITGKKSLPTDYRIFFRQTQDNNMIVYGFDNEDKIVKLASDEDALRIKGIKLGVAVFGRPDDALHFNQKPVLSLTNAQDSDDHRGIYCYFGTISKDDTIKPLTITIKGDEDGDWSFPIGPTASLYKSERSGFLFDQIEKGDDIEFKDIPNIVKLSEDKYCFLTTNMLEYRYDNEFIFGLNDDVLYLTPFNKTRVDSNGNIIMNTKDLKDFLREFKSELPGSC